MLKDSAVKQSIVMECQWLWVLKVKNNIRKFKEQIPKTLDNSVQNMLCRNILVFATDAPSCLYDICVSI